MKKEFVMSLSQSYRQDLLDAVQLAVNVNEYLSHVTANI